MLFEGALIRVGLTPTDVMHVMGDFTAYEREASALGVRIMARAAGMSEEETADAVYDAFKRKLYTNIVRVLIEDAFPDIRKEGMGEQLKTIIRDSYEQAKAGKPNEFLRLAFSTPATLVGVGAPTKLFLPEVAELLGAKALSHDYAPVANALGAVVGNVSAGKTMEIRYQQETDSYTVFGLGRRESYETLNEAKTAAKAFAESAAREEAVLRGAEESSLECKMEERENVVDTQFGSLYMGYKVTVTASGKLRLQ